jgi:hypothetical protein
MYYLDHVFCVDNLLITLDRLRLKQLQLLLERTVELRENENDKANRYAQVFLADKSDLSWPLILVDLFSRQE